MLIKKRFINTLAIIPFLLGCGGGGEVSSDASSTTIPYVPTEISEKTSIDFLSQTSFGADTSSKNALNQLGIVKWLDQQLALPYVAQKHLKRTISIAKKAEPTNNSESLADYLADNDIVFNQNVASFKTQRYQLGAMFEVALFEPDQLRNRVAYALSQIVVESLAEPLFVRRTEAMAVYMDILSKNAFGNYRDLLIDISHSSSMGLYLTFNGSKKEQQDGTTTIYPDENYARELMQLFSIGLSELNIDGTAKKDANGNTIPTYTQTDVNEMAKVFTGWDLKRSRRFGQVSSKTGDLTQPLEFTAEHHENRAKQILGTTIQAGNDGTTDIASAIDILMAHPNMAPFISKQLIMRLVKSNPTPAYIARVARVFNDNGQGVKGDLKAVVRAIYLDQEVWESKEVNKFKEPFLAYVEFLKAFNVQPLPVWRISKTGADVHDALLFNDPTSYLGQGPTRAFTAFNFYNNNYVPNETIFKQQNAVTPELQIQTDSMLIAFNNKVSQTLLTYEKHHILAKYGTLTDMDTLIANKFSPAYSLGRDKFMLDCSEEYNVMEQELEGSVDGHFNAFNGVNRANDNSADANGTTNRDRALLALIEHLDTKLTGNKLTENQKNLLFNAYKEVFYYGSIRNATDPQRKIYENIIARIIAAIVTSEAFMVQ